MDKYVVPDVFEYEGVALPGGVVWNEMLDQIRKQRLKSDDVIVTTYPKAGTTWMMYLLYLIGHNGDESGLKTSSVFKAVPFLEGKDPTADNVHVEDRLTWLTERPSPRFFATHMTLSILERQVMNDKVKIVLVIRNPKDAMVSWYHFHRMAKPLGYFPGSWDEFFDVAKTKGTMYGDFFDYYLEWWKVRNNDNILVVMYEEMKEDVAAVITKVANFTGYELSDDVVQRIVHLTSFQKMKDDPKMNGEMMAKLGIADLSKSKFIRKGEVGDWVNYFSEEQSKYIDNQCEERCTPLGLIFQWHSKQ